MSYPAEQSHLAHSRTRRPLIPAELPFPEQTSELINTFRVLRSLQQEFGPQICPTSSA